MLNPQQQPSQGVKRLRRASAHEADWGHQAPHITAPGHLSLTPGPGTLNRLSPFLVSGWSPRRSASSILSLLLMTRLRTVPGCVGSVNDQAKQGRDELPGEGGPGLSDFQRVPAWRGVPERHRCHHAAVLAPQCHELSIRQQPPTAECLLRTRSPHWIMKTPPETGTEITPCFAVRKLRPQCEVTSQGDTVSKRQKCDLHPGVSDPPSPSFLSDPKSSPRAGWILEEESWSWSLGTAPCQEG